MNRFELSLVMFGLVLSGAGTFGCEPGGIGDPCTPEDEYFAKFSGYGVQEVNIESKSFQCETRLCLVNHFQGRVSCPYGQSDSDKDETVRAEASADGPADDPGKAGFCYIPDGQKKIVSVTVPAQLIDRRASDTVYCSCRCSGPDKKSKFCECPSGYSCKLLNDVPLAAEQLSGSYCVKNGTDYVERDVRPSIVCAPGADETRCPAEGAESVDLNPK
jgi:hypothetical protein